MKIWSRRIWKDIPVLVLSACPLLFLPLFTLFWNSLFLTSMKLPHLINVFLLSHSPVLQRLVMVPYSLLLSLPSTVSPHYLSCHFISLAPNLVSTDLKFCISNHLNFFSSWTQEIWNEMPKVDYTVRGDRMYPIIEDFHSYIEPSPGKMI